MEECPSPLVVLHPEMRQAMGEAAIRAACAAGYYNAGTVEFLVDQKRRFYFLEMNTRLQVEHPITELVTGLDLVKLQVEIAAGARLHLRQEQIEWRGSAIECRIYAEDPYNDFLPYPGMITRLTRPMGPGVRVDGCMYDGWTVPMEYDPLLAKLAVWSARREEATARMIRALSEYDVGGIRTNIGFFRQILEDAEFPRRQPAHRVHRGVLRASPQRPCRRAIWPAVAALAAALHTPVAQRSAAGRTPAPRAERLAGGGKERPAAMKLELTIDGVDRPIELLRPAPTAAFAWAMRRSAPRTWKRPNRESIRSCWMAELRCQRRGAPAGRLVVVDRRLPLRDRSARPAPAGRAAPAAAGAEGVETIVSPMPGKVVRVLVAPGDAVETGQGLVVVEAMKMQNEMKAPRAGRVLSVAAKEGATVAAGETLATLE